MCILQTLTAQAELRSQKEQVSRLQEEMAALQGRYEDKSSELSSFLRRYEEKSKESQVVKMQLQAERHSSRSEVFFCCRNRISHSLSPNVTSGAEKRQRLVIRKGHKSRVLTFS